MKKRAYVIPIIVGFLVLYLFCMGLSTYFMAEHYQAQFNYEYTNVVSNLIERFSYTTEDGLTDIEDYMGFLISQTGNTLSSMDYQQYSVAVYDANGKKITQSGNYIQFYVKSSNKYYYYQLEDYLSHDELEEFMSYYIKLHWRPGSIGSNYLVPSTEYALYGSIEKETGELLALYITHGSTNDDAMSIYTQEIIIDPLWCWESPKYQAHDHGLLYLTGDYIAADQNIVFPFLYNGLKCYEEWNRNEFLQGHPETREFQDVMPSSQTISKLKGQTEMFGSIAFLSESYGEEIYRIVLRSSSQPLLAAMDYLKYIYVISFLVMLACMLKVVFTANKTYKKQLALEETRRSFTSVVAKDLEIPLEKIQASTENVKANGLVTNREEELKQIVEQTEIMDEMIQELIQISKQDS